MRRRQFLVVSIGGPTLVGLVAARPAVARGRVLAATPACAGPTPRQTAGPFFKPSSPERTSLREPGLAGTPLLLTGRVVTVDCAPVPRAVLDVWQADDRGEYDNAGFRLRGHQYADAEGRYRLETIVPGLYPGRTRHLHVNIHAPDRTVLTTQLYFPWEGQNRRDGIFDPALVVAVDGDRTAPRAAYDFVLGTQGRRAGS